MQDINILNINGNIYRIVDPTKITNPVNGQVGQVLTLDTSLQPMWSTINQSNDTQLVYSPIIVYQKNNSNVIELDITSSPDNYIAHVSGIIKGKEVSLPLYSEDGIKTITKQTSGDMSQITLLIGTQAPSVSAYYIYLGYPRTLKDIPVSQRTESRPSDIIYYYGTIGAGVPLKSLSEFNVSTLENALLSGSMTKVEKITNNLHTMTLKEGEWSITLMPSGYSAQIFNGWNTYTYFDEQQDSQGNIISCGGTQFITINDAVYAIYGKFCCIEETVQILIPEVNITHKSETTVDNGILHIF